MQSIQYYKAVIVLSSILISLASNANETSNEIDMSRIEQTYQNQLLLDEQYQNVQQTQPVEDIRARRLREWHEQNQTQPAAMNQPNIMQNVPTAPEADDLFVAATSGNNSKIGTLLAQGLDVNTANVERETALHMAAARGHYSTVIYLINHGAYTNAQTVKNWIPLHHAVRFRHPNIANYLIKKGASPSIRTSDGLSAVDMAKGVNDHRLLSILGAR